MNMLSEEDAIDMSWDKSFNIYKEKTIEEKKKEVKELLENDTELLNDIIVEIRKDKIDKINKCHR